MNGVSIGLYINIWCFMVNMDRCIICQNDTGSSLVKLREKGCQGMMKASKVRGDNLSVQTGQFVHQDCRKTYTNPNEILKDKKQKNVLKENTNSINLRSRCQFSFRDHCFFCGLVAKKESKNDIFPVRTDDFQAKILHVCKERDDDWAITVKGRLESINDLHAADAIYHQTCSVNFRTSKSQPKAFSPDSKTKKTRGRPPSLDAESNFKYLIGYLERYDDEQVTISDLVKKMDELCEDSSYSAVHMKRKLKNHFGDKIIITDIIGKTSVVTLRDTATSILHDFYTRSRCKNPEDEKKAIIEAAAQLIKSDIRSMRGVKDSYPTALDIGSVNTNFEYVSESLRLLLLNLFSEKDCKLKVSSVGQAIMQAARPRILLAPLQLGLGVQIHHSFASRFLVSTLHSLGFSLSYSEVQKFEENAAASQGLDIPGDVNGSFIQFVADNVDHNVRTLDGNNTFHGMGIITGVTPGTFRKRPIPRTTTSTDDIIKLAKINIEYYNPKSSLMTEMTYREIKRLRTLDKTLNLDLLSLMVWPIKNPTPGWSGVMQMVYKGNFPGKTSVVFLPMIDMNPSDMTCIYSTLMFIYNQANRYNRTPVLTFDQPLFWKAMTVVWNEQSDSQLKSLVIRLGGFHTEMSFLGCIGHIMSGSGLQEILEEIYASNAVLHMFSGKAVTRAIRGHMLVDTALHCLLGSELFGFEVPLSIDTRNSDKNQETTENDITNC